MGASPMVSTGEAPVPQKLRKSPPINVGVVVKGHRIILLEAVENSPQLAEHRLVIRMIGGWDVGTTEQAAFQARVVEDLLILEAVVREGGAEKRAQRVFVDVFMADQRIVGGELLEKILVGVEERRSAFFTAVPDEDHVAGLLEDAAEFELGFFAIEPMERLHGGDGIHPMLGKRRCLGGGLSRAGDW